MGAMMNRADIEAEFDRFFEFETDDRRTVTSVSCRLFAEALVKMDREACAKTCESIATVPSSLWSEDGCWAHAAEACAAEIRGRS